MRMFCFSALLVLREQSFQFEAILTSKAFPMAAFSTSARIVPASGQWWALSWLYDCSFVGIYLLNALLANLFS